MPTPHVIILGGGFAGLAAARELRPRGSAPSVRVTLIDRTNHHTFQPLLYQVATAALAPSDIAVPIRWRLRRQRNTTVLLGDVTSIDPARKVVMIDGARELAYDYLIVATGARHSYFGHDEWERFAPGLKSLEDARELRQRFLMSFENAERTLDDVARRAELTFVIVGGGPTGVELAGAIPLIARKALRRDFRNVDTASTRVLLVEAGKRLLSAFPEDLSRAAQDALESLGVEVRTGTPVTHIDADGVTIGKERIATKSIFWAAGNAASPLGRMLDAETDKAGRVKVDEALAVPAHPEIFVAGDLAIAMRPDGTPAPAVAPTANQTGAHAAQMILRDVRGQARTPFRYFHKGDLATIGRNHAVAAFGRIHVRGYLAWLLWLFVHLMYLVGFRNRLSVIVQWGFAYFTYERGVRLIEGAPGAKDERAQVDDNAYRERLAGIGHYASGLLHAVNNTLNPLMSASYLLKESATDPAVVREYADTIAEAAARGAALTGRVKDFVRQQPVVHRSGVDRTFDLARLTSEILDSSASVRHSMTRRYAPIAFVREITYEQNVRGDAVDVRVAIEAIIQNAIDATDARRDARGDDARILIRVFGDDTVGCIQIVDAGDGMTTETQQRAFDPFFTTRKVDRLGLGLSQAYGIATRYGGAVTIDTIVAGQMSVTLRLPRAARAQS